MSNLSNASTAPKEQKEWLSGVFIPTDDHVLVGRGKVCYRHSGNKQLSEIVQSFMTEYAAAESTKKSKSQMIKKIVDIVRGKGADFVKYDINKASWYKVDERTAREKVSQSESSGLSFI